MITVAAGGEAVQLALTVTTGMSVGVDIAYVYPPTTGTISGDADLARATLGTLGSHTKFFDGGAGLAAALKDQNGCHYGTGAGERNPVVCIKQIDDAALNAWMGTLTDDAVLVFDQEADRITTPAVTTPAYKRLDGLRKAHPNGGRVKLCLDLDTYKQVDAVTAGETWQDFVGPLAGVIDLVGGDTYVTPGYRITWSPAYFLSWLPKAAALGRCGWCIPEFGVQNSTKSPGTEQDAADVYTRAVAWARANGCSWVNYWWASGSNGNWRHADTAPLTLALKADIAATN